MTHEQVKIGIALTAGLCIGGGLGYIIAERKVRKEAEADVDRVRDMFRRLREEENADKVDSEAPNEEGDRIDSSPKDLTQEVTNLEYAPADMFKIGQDPNYIPPTTHTLGDEDFDEQNTDEDLEQDVEYMRKIRIVNPNREIVDPDDVTQWDRSSDYPYIITEAEFRTDAENYEKLSLTYYRGDDTLAEADETYIPAPDETVGLINIHDHWGAGSNDPNTMYIRNERIEADFEITLNEDSYLTAVSGFDIESRMSKNKRPIKKMRP